MSGDFMPAWSPDGREIAYYGFRQGRRQLFVVPVEGGGPSRGRTRFGRISGSPTGHLTAVAWSSTRTGPAGSSCTSSSARRRGRWGSPRQLTTEGGQEARWSPDGSTIVYLRDSGIWLIDPGGGAPRLLIDTSDAGAPPEAATRAVGARRPHASTTRRSMPRGGRASGRYRQRAARRDCWCGSTIPRGHRHGRSSPPTGSDCTSPFRSGRAISGRWRSTAGKETPAADDRIIGGGLGRCSPHRTDAGPKRRRAGP